MSAASDGVTTASGALEQLRVSAAAATINSPPAAQENAAPIGAGTIDAAVGDDEPKTRVALPPSRQLCR
jgi:hypothetical protein